MRLEIAVGLYLVACCVALGFAAADGGALGASAMITLGVFSSVVIRRVEARRSADLTSMFLVALAARYLVAVLVEHVVYSPAALDRPGLFAPDELQYFYEARIYAEHLAGRLPSLDDEINVVWSTAPMRIAGYCFYLFGAVNLVPKMLICTFGAWTSVLTALIAEELFPGSGRRAGWMTALFPSLVLWTSLVLKDGVALLGVEVFLTAFILRVGRTRLSAPLVVLLAVPGLGAIAASRAYEMGFLAAAVVGALLIGRGGRFGRNLGLYAVVSLALVLFMQRYIQQPVDFTGDESPLAKLAAIRSGFAEGTGSAIRHDIVDVRSPAGLVAWIPIGLAYFFFAPLPFTGGSIISAATTPEMLVWYAMLPSMWRGLRRASRERSVGFLVLFLFTMSSAIGWSILVTNVGTIYRFRAQIMFVLLILAAYDRCSRRSATAVDPAAGVTLHRRTEGSAA
jgi:hypothetical protein